MGKLLRILLFAVLTSVVIAFLTAWYGWSKFSELASTYDLSSVGKMDAASTVLDRTGKAIGQIQLVNRRPVSLDGVSKWMTAAVVATEDARFYSHSGVDPIGVLRAALHNLRSGAIRQGASTITQQLARDSFSIRERTYRRKLLEMALAVRIEDSMPKKDILETYLNRIYFGAGFYGVESASIGYFGKPASLLNPSESAMLAALIRSPNALSPWKNLQRAEQGRKMVLGQMLEQKMINKVEYDQWISSPPEIVPKCPEKGESYVIESVRIALGDVISSELALRGGLVIRTTIDMDLQLTAETAIREQVKMVESRPEMAGKETMSTFLEKFEALRSQDNQPTLPSPKYLQAALVAVENSSGGILAIVGGRSFLHSEYNRVTLSRRPPAGLFSPFVALSALESGMNPGAVFEDWPLDNKFVGIGGAEGVLGEWGVESEYNSYEGKIPMRKILLKGKNAALVRMGFSVGLEKLSDISALAGFRVSPDKKASSYVEGVSATPLELALAYTCFPRLGTRPSRAFLISEVVSPSGEVIYSAKPETTTVSSAASAWIVDSILREGLQEGPSARVREYAPSLSNVGVRAGTSYGFEDAWFAGYDGEISVVAWMGFDKPSQIFRGAFGSDITAPLWAQVIKKSARPSPAPARPEVLEKFDICAQTGEKLTPQCPPSSRGTSEFAIKPGPPPCSEHSGMLVLPKDLEESPWPRAQQLVDTRTVRPVNIERGYIPKSADPYESLSPSASPLSSVRVEPAQPADTAAKTPPPPGEQNSESVPSSSPAYTPEPIAPPLPSAPPASPPPLISH